MKILITGARGQLGRTLAEELARRGHDIDAPTRAALDLRAPQADIAAYVAASAPDWVVNCAAMTDVDGCEAEPELALQLNARAPAALAEAASANGARLLQVSTDYVFAGDATRPYREDDPTGPLGAYGRSKLAGEQAVRAAAPDALIVRTSWLYSVHGRNFFKTMLRLFAEQESLRVVDDQVGSPTAVPDLAAALAELIARDASGLMHAANGGACSWHAFAVAIRDEALAAGLIEREVAIEPVTTREFPRPAPRPGYSVLDSSRLARALGRPMRPWREALGDVVAQWRQRSRDDT